MRLGLALLLSLLPYGLVWADMTVLYRKADGLVAGYAYPGQPVEQELSNILQSELGGTAADYATLTVPRLTPRADRKVRNAVLEETVPADETQEIPLSDLLAGGGAIAGAASLVLVARKKKAAP